MFNLKKKIMKTLNRKKSNLLFAALFVCAAFLLISFSQGVEEWLVPDKYKTMKNPTSSTKEDLAIGKSLYKKHCKSCHGAEGLGDGTKAEGLDTPCGDFSSEEFQSQTDGELFYKSTEGRDEMPSFTKTIKDDEDRWLIVNYLRTFKE